MRKIVVAITAASLAVSMLAMAIPAAAAVTGFDSAYAGESAFVNLAVGQSNDFQVFFANTGTTAWTVGTTTQVDLAACLNDKVTCNAQDPEDAPFNPGTWLSATRYATTTQSSVAPGSIGTFKYTVTVAAGTAAGTYDFNGDLVLHSTGATIHPEGYFQDVTVGAAAGAATITSISPTTGTTAGGTTVTVNGTGFVCTPAFPTVTFGTNNAAVTSCGASVLTVTSPASTTGVGAVNVTVTNSGAPASNAVTFNYADLTPPTYNSVTVQGSVVTVSFSEPVCDSSGAQASLGDWSATVNGITDVLTATSIPNCDANSPHANAVSSFNMFLTTAAPNGSFVAVTLNSGTNTVDVFNNHATAPRTNTTTATATPTTKPTFSSASGTGGSNIITLNFSEPVWCAVANTADWSVSPGLGVITADGCPASAAAAKTKFTITTTSNMANNTTYTVTYTNSTSNLQDIFGNQMTSPSSVTFTSGAPDTTPPTITDLKVTNNVGSTDFGDANDAFAVTFSEAMNATNGGFTFQDSDGTSDTVTCGTNATCTWNSTDTVVTVTMTGAITVNSAGTTPGLQLPATLKAVTGLTDQDGNQTVNLIGSSDTTLDFQ